MTIHRPSRRRFLATSVAALPLGAGLAHGGGRQQPGRRLRVVCVGGHPDDPESGCGGTLARYVDAGHAVTALYLTRGERGIPGTPLAEAAAIRTREAERACALLGARPLFAGQIDGATEVTPPRIERITSMLGEIAPDLVFTHWPLDTHLDHQIASLLTFRAWQAAGQRFALYCFEVNAGEQTIGFTPTDYVDITPVREKKRLALLAHESQDGAAIYRDHHEPMERFRGREAGTAAAEAFVRVAPGRDPAMVLRP